MQVAGKNITVVGGRRSGIAVSKLLQSKGAEVFLTEGAKLKETDRTVLLQDDIRFEEDGHTSKALDRADFLVLSPGVPTRAKIVQDAMKRHLSIYSEIEVASWFCAAPMVTITGSNGKTTTTSLAAHIFRESGRKTYSGGNIGVPFSSFSDEVEPDALVVLEVSSFQLDYVDTFKPTVSVILNITPDHLDRYDNDFEKYAASKLRIIENQSSGDIAIYCHDDVESRSRVERAPNYSEMKSLSIGIDDNGNNGAFVRNEELVIRLDNKEEVLMQVNETTLRGQHNIYNTLAAAVAARVMDVRSEIIRDSVSSFEGVPHRLEFVRDFNGVSYYNDSKATNVNALWYALESFSEPIVLIAGGLDKGNDYSAVADLVAKKVKILIALGDGGPKIVDELGHLVETVTLVDEMDDAIRFANVMSDPGDIVLLSPACASFDMFESYEHRGNEFKDLVNDLG